MDIKVLLFTFLFGIGWGIGGIYWGKAIAAVGMALGISLLIGFTNVFGSIGPMLIYQPETLLTSGGITLIISLVIMIAGVLIISIAGQKKEKELSGQHEINQGANYNKTPFIVGFIFCLISGFLSALVNIGFIYGAPISEAAIAMGTATWASAFAIWVLVFTGNFGANLVYSLILMKKNNSFALFKKGKPAYWLWGLFMGITWPAGILLYGIAANMMGEFGAYVGFPMMLLFSIVAGNLAGVISGEWKGTANKSRMIMISGILVLILAFIFLSYANKLLS